MRSKEKLLLVLALTFALPATPASAHQPSDVIRVAETISVEGPSKQITGSFTLQTQGGIPLSVQIPPLRTAAFEFRYSPDKLILTPGKRAEIKFAGTFYKDGKWQVAPRVEYYTTDGKPIGRLYVDSYFLVRDGKFFRSSYAELFLKRELRDQQLGPLFRAVPVSPNTPRAPDYKNKRPSPKDTLKRAKELPSLKASLSPVEDGPAQFLAASYEYSLSSKHFHAAFAPRRTIRLHGNFTWFGADGLLYPAYFWTVSAYTGRDGDWHLAGSDPVQGDGNWEFSIPYSSGPIRIVYGAESTYIIPVDESNDRYQWAHDIESVTDTVDVGSYSAPGPPGLGELYSEAMAMLTALVWNAEINPLDRGATSIRAVFPNTRYTCGGSNPWTCYNSGTIWVTSAHALQRGTVIHELGHGLHDVYWWDDLPGGSHTLTGCFNPWLALSEGFADFMPDWVLSDRAATNPSAFGFLIENPSAACMSPLATNESWVAAALWDLHDTNNDVADRTMFPGRGDVVKIFLEALGTARERTDLSRRIRSMVGIGSTYKRQAASRDGAPSEASINDILRQDFIIP